MVVEDGHQDEEGHSVVVRKAAGQGKSRVVFFPQEHRREIQDEGLFIIIVTTNAVTTDVDLFSGFSLDRGIVLLLLLFPTIVR